MASFVSCSRDLPEKFIDGQEDTYLNWFYDHYSYNQSAITPKDREEYIKQYSKHGALRAGLNTIEQSLKMQNKTKNMPKRNY